MVMKWKKLAKHGISLKVIGDVLLMVCYSRPEYHQTWWWRI